MCLLSFPTPRYDAGQRKFVCDPDADPRGWQYRVYAYRLRAAYTGPDSQHACGGAVRTPPSDQAAWGARRGAVATHAS